jgi:hypothetical protein
MSRIVAQAIVFFLRGAMHVYVHDIIITVNLSVQ